MKNKTIPKRVDFAKTARDRLILRLGALGRPAAYIAAAANCTISQVRYRLNNRAGMRLVQIRQGTDKYRLMETVEHHPAVMAAVEKRVDQMLRAERIVINGRMAEEHHLKKGNNHK